MRIEPDSGERWWWIGKRGTELADGEWHSTNDKRQYLFDSVADAEGSFISIVNPSTAAFFGERWNKLWLCRQTITDMPWFNIVHGARARAYAKSHPRIKTIANCLRRS